MQIDSFCGVCGVVGRGSFDDMNDGLMLVVNASYVYDEDFGDEILTGFI